MTNGLPLMLADDGIGVSGMRSERRFPRPPQPIGSPFHDIAKTVVVKRNLFARREILRQCSTRSEDLTWGIPGKPIRKTKDTPMIQISDIVLLAEDAA
jgi:hypothetical protein